MAPTVSPPTFSGMPPVRHEAPWSARAPRRPFVTCSSISRLGRTKIAAVRALSSATRELAIWASGVRRIWISSPEGSTIAITTRWPRSVAYFSAAATTASEPASSMILRVLTRPFRSRSLWWRWCCGIESGSPDRVVRRDEQDVAIRAAEHEVHRARQADLADEVAVAVEDLD